MSVARLEPVIKPDWNCLDCIADPCVNQSHAWVQATRITRDDGSEAWLVQPEEPNGHAAPQA